MTPSRPPVGDSQLSTRRPTVPELEQLDHELRARRASAIASELGAAGYRALRDSAVVEPLTGGPDRPAKRPAEVAHHIAGSRAYMTRWKGVKPPATTR